VAVALGQRQRFGGSWRVWKWQGRTENRWLNLSRLLARSL
jgi:hypothetical protein